MDAVLILDPDLRFDALCEVLAASGWRLTEQTRNPVVAGEPERAVFEHDTANQLVYTFNPVCRLRLVDRSGVTDSRALAGLAPLDAEVVCEWLTSSDERTILRGLLGVAQLGDPGMLPTVEALRNHPRPALAQVATRTAQHLRSLEDGEVADQQAQLVATIELLKPRLMPLLQALSNDRDGTLMATLRPRPDDYARVFVGHAARFAREKYEAAWVRDAPRVRAVDPGSQLHIHLTPAGSLTDDTPLARAFPDGYRTIHHLLDPERLWVRWTYVRPNQPTGVAYDGLVWVDDRWSWFPKPYRMLAPLIAEQR